MNLTSSRRGFLGTLGAVAAALATPRKLFGAKPSAPQPASSITGLGQSGNPYQELGVSTVINGEGTMTTLGGSLIRPEVEAVMAQAARHFVSISELEAAAGKRIAQMLKLPQGYSALVTSGAAGAIQSGLAGILTGDNESLIKQLPDLTGMKSEVIIQKSHRNPFDHQLRATGIKLIEVETHEQLRRAVSERTAMMHFTNFANAAGQIKVDEWPKLAKQFNVPCMLIGREELVHYALLNNSPNEDTLGRGQKVGKEEIVGMVKALEIYLSEDHDALAREWQQRLENISTQITKIPGVSTSFFIPDIANHVPHMQITWDKRVSLTPKQASQLLRSGQPSVVIGGGEERPGLAMNSFMLQPGEDQIIAEQLVKVLHAHSA